jgi:predicted small secreted protein
LGLISHTFVSVVSKGNTILRTPLKKRIMKKVFFALVVLSGFTLASCKKDYTCDCRKVRTDDDGNVNTSSDGTYTFKDSRVRAEDKCNDLEGSGSDILGDYTRECDI